MTSKKKWCWKKSPEDGGDFRETGGQTEARGGRGSSSHRPAHAEDAQVVKLGKNTGLCGYVDYKGCRKYR